MALDTPAVPDGKASSTAAYESAYDQHASDAGIDEYGESVTDFEDELDPDPGDGGADPDQPDGEQDPVADPDGPATGEPDSPDGQQAAQADDGQPLLAPHTWPQQWKDQLAAIAEGKVSPREGARMILEMNSHMNRGFTQRMGEIGALRRDLGSVTEALRPHQERLQRAGIAPDVAIQRSLAWDAHIQRDPQQGILDMAHAYGVDLQQVMSSRASEAQYLTPQERALQQVTQQQAGTLTQLQQEVQSFRDFQQKQDFSTRQANANYVLQEFMQATDEQGNHLHPFIEYVAPAMAKLLKGGAAANLDEAYQIATIRDPQIQGALRKQRQAARLKQAQRQAEKARTASGGNIIGKPGGKPGKTVARDSRKVFEDAYDRATNAR